MSLNLCSWSLTEKFILSITKISYIISYQFSINGTSRWRHFHEIVFLAAILKIPNMCFILIFVDI